VLNGSAVFLGALFCMSQLAAMRLLHGHGESALQAYAIPAFGAIALLAIIGIDVAQSDAVTRWIELGGLALGVPFSLWRGRQLHLRRLLPAQRYELEG